MSGRIYGHMPKEVYYQCIWLVKDLDRLRKLEAMSSFCDEIDAPVFFDDVALESSERRVLKQACVHLDCIRKALDKIPEEYRVDLLDNIVYGGSAYDFAHENTWKKWRTR